MVILRRLLQLKQQKKDCSSCVGMIIVIETVVELGARLEEYGEA